MTTYSPAPRLRSWPLAAAMLVLLTLCAAGCNQDTGNFTSSTQDPNWDVQTNQPPAPQTFLAMARLLASQGKDGQAQFVLERMLRDTPDYLPTYVELAELQMRHDRVDQARTILEQGLKQKPEDCVLLNDMGMTYVVKNQYKEARPWFERAAKACPNDPKYRSNLATCVGMLGSYDESFKHYQVVLSYSQAHYNVGVLAQARNDHARAQQEFMLADAPPPPPAEEQLPTTQPATPRPATPAVAANRTASPPTTQPVAAKSPTTQPAATIRVTSKTPVRH